MSRETAATTTVELTQRQIRAAAAVLRGYLQRQRERRGAAAVATTNFRLVAAALAALENAEDASAS